MTWRFTDQTRTAVCRELADGAMESKLVACDDIQAIIADVLDPVIGPEPVPGKVSPLQMRRALSQAGLRQSVEDYVATLDINDRDAWEYATEIRRDSPIIAAGAQALGLSAEEIDGLFRAAEAITS